jgi:hypothetical protein
MTCQAVKFWRTVNVTRLPHLWKGWSQVNRFIGLIALGCAVVITLGSISGCPKKDTKTGTATGTKTEMPTDTGTKTPTDTGTKTPTDTGTKTHTDTGTKTETTGTGTKTETGTKTKKNGTDQ